MRTKDVTFQEIHIPSKVFSVFTLFAMFFFQNQISPEQPPVKSFDTRQSVL